MFNRELASIINGLSGLLQQVLPLLVILEVVRLSPTKLAALIAVIGLVLTFISTTVIRTQVAPKQDVITALNMPAGSSEKDLKKEIDKQI